MIVEGMLFPRSYLCGPPEMDPLLEAQLEREAEQRELLEFGACFEEGAPLYLAGLGDSPDVPVAAEDFAPLGYVPTDDDLPF
jgi:hypothetical protein